MKYIVIHCAATQNGQILGDEKQNMAEKIDACHQRRGFRRQKWAYQSFNTYLKHIGYHYVIDCDGSIATGRREGEQGAHVKGYNRDSIGICLAGTDKFTQSQWDSLKELIQRLRQAYPEAEIKGHRDFSPDLDGDGTVEPFEWLKICPGFDVEHYISRGLLPAEHKVCGVK